MFNIVWRAGATQLSVSETRHLLWALYCVGIEASMCALDYAMYISISLAFLTLQNLTAVLSVA